MDPPRSGSWGQMAFDQQMALMPGNGAACDQGGLMQQHHEQSLSIPRSQSQDADWQRIMEEFDAQNGQLPIDYDLLPTQPATHSTSTAPTYFQQQHQSPPMQSIEPSAACEMEPQLSAAPSSNSSSFSYLPSEQQYELWGPTSAPPATYPTLIPNHDAWSDLNSYDNGILMPTCYPMEIPTYEPTSHAAHFINSGGGGGPSPMLSQGSPLHQDFLDEGFIPPFLPDNSSSSDDVSSDPCYAQLLYRCLKEAPEHTLSLKELYDWVRDHSQKAKDPKQRGWQNSVRHNLSMNAAFERVPPNQIAGIKKGSLWRLTPHALRDGVISTTRYRKDPKRSKPAHSQRSSPALKRQISGAKGGQATRRRHQALLRGRYAPYTPPPTMPPLPQQQRGMMMFGGGGFGTPEFEVGVGAGGEGTGFGVDY